MSLEATAQALLRRAFDALNERDLDEAEAAGLELKAMRHSAAFEVLAHVHSARGDGDAAIAVLEEGVAAAPRVWLLWQLLGNTRSDQGDYDGAAEAYRGALACPDVDPTSVHYNQAAAQLREGRHEDALASLDQIPLAPDDDRLTLLVVAARANALLRLGRLDDAVRLGELALGRRGGGELAALSADVTALLGQAVLARDRDADRADELVAEALAWSKGSTEALWLWRELHGRKTPGAKHYRLRVRGTWHEPIGGARVGFYSTCEVVAPDEDEALRLAAAIEPAEVRASIEADQVQLVAETANTVTGVYASTGSTFYELEPS